MRETFPFVAFDNRREHALPTVGAVDVAGTQLAALQIAKLVEQKQRMIAGAFIMAVPECLHRRLECRCCYRTSRMARKGTHRQAGRARTPHATRRAAVSATGDPSLARYSAKGSHWPRCKPRYGAVGEVTVTPANSEQRCASVVLRENGAGMAVVAFAHYGIQHNKNDFRALSIARSKPRHERSPYKDVG
jgi:hypothetical protein